VTAHYAQVSTRLMLKEYGGAHPNEIWKMGSFPKCALSGYWPRRGGASFKGQLCDFAILMHGVPVFVDLSVQD
jgi:hypothetical protein